MGWTTLDDVSGTDQQRADAAVDPRDVTEDWLTGQGVPHFIVDYSATEDIFTRAALPLTLIFILELLNGINTETFDWWLNVIAAVVGVGIGVGVFALVNTVRGRPPFRRPDDIGAVELGIFIIVPPLVPLVFDQPRQAIVTFGANIALVVLAYVLASYAVPAIVLWALRQAGAQLRNITNLMVRSLPLLLLFTMFMFLNAEVWKVADDIPTTFLAAALGLLIVIGSAFVLLRAPTELAGLGTFASWREARTEAAGTPALELAERDLPEPPAPTALSRRERLNVTFVLFFTQAVQILVVTALIFAFYLVFGIFTVIPSTIEQWTGTTDLDVLVEIPLLGTDAVISGELVRTGLLIAAVAGLQFTVAALTDESYRTEFYAGITSRIRTMLAVRALYRQSVIATVTLPG